MAGRYWREAASLIIVGRNLQYKSSSQLSPQKTTSVSSKVDYNIIFLKRSARSSFMPSVYVFPGGALDVADLNPKWLSLYEEYGFSKADILKLFRFPNNRLEMYTNKSEGDLVPELAVRLCALRETFEETGLLLTASSDAQNGSSVLFELEKDELKKWRSRVHDDASEFMKLFQHINRIPSFSSLLEWSSWLTPTWYTGGLKSRFDTTFYITFIDSEIPLYLHDVDEAEELKTSSPIEMLREFKAGECILKPPQYYELLRMANFSNFLRFRDFSLERVAKGLTRFLTVMIPTKDGIVAVLPGDKLYPEAPNYYQFNDSYTLDQTLEELKSSSGPLHRILMNEGNKFTFRLKDVVPLDGHLESKEFL